MRLKPAAYIPLLVLIAVGFAPQAIASQKQADDLIVQDPVMIPTRDGASIYAIVVRKKSVSKKLPATLFFTPYYQDKSDIQFAKIPAERGYVGVVAYSRGIRTDLRTYVPYVHDGNDASDVINWISRQPWSNGKVGMFGGSYLGFVQWSVLRDPPHALKTIVPSVAVMPGFDFPAQNNVGQSYALIWANSILDRPPLAKDFSAKWFQSGTAYQSLDQIAGRPNRIFQQWLQHPAYDHYWSSLVPTPAEYAAIHIPILVTEGYYDGDQLGSLQYIKQYLKYNANPELYLLIGPYDHFGAQRIPAAVLNGYRIDPVARINIRSLVFSWLGHVLKNRPRPVILKNRINYEVMGADEWWHVASLNAMHNHALRFYLAGNKQGGNYLLDTHQPVRDTYLEQSVDFRDRTTQNNYFSPFIMLDKLDPSHGLVFASQPFAHAAVISGSFSGLLTFTINKRDFDFSLAFYELLPNGKYFYLTYSLGRASYAKNLSRRELLTPNAKETIAFAPTRMVSRLMVKGSRLVVVLNVNKNEYDEINYGSGKPVEDESMQDAGASLHVRWYDNSFITVPVQNNRPP